MFASIKHLTECISIESHTDCSHLSDSIASVDHMPTPSIHDFSELWEIIRGLIRISLFNFIISADVPKVSPLGIKGWGSRCCWFVLFGISIKAFTMIFGFLFVLWGSSDLIIIIRIDVLCRFVSIVVFRPCREVLLECI